ncbi:hypothetical protein [Catellatospora tritici]|uniref:hypothetical protein n=1 Tax=Catellatospora tritici TaxID=2851566 RepID=UPI001C2D2382|nr:hypothetical protein [Catellatospora tritici]MBV1855743.1 hypothetical protein [Catellatospora tritici]
MAMPIRDLVQDRLALFVHDADTGAPIRKVPIYAEVVVGPAAEKPRLGCDAMRKFERRAPEQAAVVEQELMARVSPAWASGLCDRLIAMIRGELSDSGFQVDAVVDDAFRQAARDAVDRAVHEFKGQHVKPVSDVPTTRYPLGVLATDHVGFVSFDLARLSLRDVVPRETHDRMQVEILAYPMLLEQRVVRVLDQRRIAPDAVVGKLGVPLGDAGVLQQFALDLPAMQNPGLVDWRLSPGSFAAVPQTLVGADGCESLTPANFAISRFHLRQVVRLPVHVPNTTFAAARVHEFAVSLIPIGHSLGRVQYSLPLAPGESVRFAIIDWRREDSAVRTESKQVTEDLLHAQSHDRMLTETVSAAIDEWQRGGSVMGGLAGGAGASKGGVVGGGMLSIGGGYATSSGSRDLVGETSQKITDAVHQASSSIREQHATVVVQTDEHERQDIETRAIVNYNRGHSLTVLYYEVLQHFRVVTELTRRYQAVLLPRPQWNFDDDTLLLDKRFALEGALLESGLAGAFDSLVRIDKVRSERKRNPPQTITSDAEGDLTFTRFRTFFEVGGEETPNELTLSVRKKDKAIVPLMYGGSTNYNKDSQFNHESITFQIESDSIEPPIAWKDIDCFIFRKGSGSIMVKVINIAITGIGPSGERIVHAHVPGAIYTLDNDGDQHMLSAAAPPPPPKTVAAPTFDQQVAPDDFASRERLISHLKRESDYYTRVLDLSTNPNWYARTFETEDFAPGTLKIDVVAPTPLEVLGNNIAFPLLDQKDLEPLDDDPRTETLISLPTRGLFAEAKLGHCNVAEEIKETRFWRWDEHPLPFLASDIAAVQPIQPKVVERDLTSSDLPTPAATVQEPVALPAPTGLAAALTALATPNIFRDMSVSDEVGALLDDLVKGSVSMAQAATKAQEIQSKMDTDLDRQKRDQVVRLAEAEAGVRRSEAEARRAETEARREKQQQVTPAQAAHAIEVAESQARKGNLTKDELKEVAQTQVSNMRGSKPVTPAAPLKLKFAFRYSISHQVFEGAFQVTIDVPGKLEMADITTSRGVAEMDIGRLPVGEYAVTLVGTRTRPPDLAPASVTVPALGEMPTFDVTLNKHLNNPATQISGNGKLKVTTQGQLPVLEVVVTESATEATKEIEFKAQDTAQKEVGGAFNAAVDLKDVVTIGSTAEVKAVTGSGIEQGKKYTIKIPITYLSGGLTIN